jgi:photosystem II stability/assembly factor-like uncharacterized protein
MRLAVHREHRSSPLFAAIALTLVTACGSSAAAPDSAGSPSIVRDAGLVADREGWALTGDGLKWTTTGGQTWTTITPPGLTAPAMVAVTFADTSHGWLVTSGTRPQVYRTSDRGGTWASADAPAYKEGIPDLQFLDALRGWLFVSSGNANFSYGDLYSTNDGGLSWTKLTSPSGGQLRMISVSVGWLASRDKLFRTTDGGASWSAVAVDASNSLHAGEPRAYGAPNFFGPKGLVPITYAGVGHSTEAMYATDDGGSTWRLAAEVDLTDETGADVSIPWTAIDADTWFAAAPSGKTVLVASRGNVSTAAPTTLAQGIRSLTARSANLLWAVAKATKCVGPKANLSCTESAELHVSTNQGRSWRVLAP